MTETEKRALMGGCDGSCLDHPENPNYCKPVCDVRKLWKEARAVDVSREIDYGLFLHPDDGKRPRWIPRRYKTLPQARAAALEITSSRTGDARKVEIHATGRGCHIDTTCQLVELERDLMKPYDELPQVTKDYADFICNVHSLGSDVGVLYGVEDRRIQLHEEMVAEYGLRYEYTRTAVAQVGLMITDTMRPERVAQIIDANLRYIRNNQPEARTEEAKA